jgi:hypothetical protein
MMPSTTQLITGVGCFLLLLGVFLLGGLAFRHMSRRDSADDVGPDVEEQELAQGLGRLIDEGRIDRWAS